MKPRLSFEDDDIVIRIRKQHPQVLPFYPNYDVAHPSPLAVEDYTKIDNCVGHSQRAWLCHYFLKAFVEHGGIAGIELGSAGIAHIGGISTDMIGSGETPEYGGIMEGVQIKTEASNLSTFGDGAFSCVLSSHLIEHLGECVLFEKWLYPIPYPHQPIRPQLSNTQKASVRKSLQCDGSELIDVIKNHWLRVVRPGGYVGFITPDQDVAERNGITCFDYDPNHIHALSATKFGALLEKELGGIVEIVECNTFKNNFSWNWICKRL
jgi:hypothetical protein